MPNYTKSELSDLDIEKNVRNFKGREITVLYFLYSI